MWNTDERTKQEDASSIVSYQLTNNKDFLVNKTDIHISIRKEVNNNLEKYIIKEEEAIEREFFGKKC